MCSNSNRVSEKKPNSLNLSTSDVGQSPPFDIMNLQPSFPGAISLGLTHHNPCEQGNCKTEVFRDGYKNKNKLAFVQEAELND